MAQTLAVIANKMQEKICQDRKHGALRISQNAAMDAAWIKERLGKQPGKRRSDLARALGINQSQVTRMLNGERQIKLYEVPKIRAFFGEPAEEDRSAFGEEPARAAPFGDKQLTPRDWPRDVPVYGSGSCGEDGLFEFNTGDAIDFERRPPRLAGIREAFALFIANNSMFPWRRHGQTVYVHPGLPVRADDFVVVELHPKRDEVDKTPEAYIKQLARMNSEAVILHQFNPVKDIIVPRRRIKRMLRIVDWDELLGI